MRGSDCFAGFKSDGIALVNEREGMVVPKAKAKQKIFVVPANKIAQEVIGRPLGNTALIGAFAAATGELDFDSVSKAIKERFAGKIADLNIEAAKKGFDFIKKSNR
jgi:pyruvate ferredoxin oxidoreductase gamma subunit